MNKNDRLALCCLCEDDEKTIRRALAIALDAPEALRPFVSTRKPMLWIAKLAIETQKLIALGLRLFWMAGRFGMSQECYFSLPTGFKAERDLDSHEEIHVEYSPFHQHRIDCMYSIYADATTEQLEFARVGDREVGIRVRKCEILAYRIYMWAVDALALAKEYEIS